VDTLVVVLTLSGLGSSVFGSVLVSVCVFVGGLLVGEAEESDVEGEGAVERDEAEEGGLEEDGPLELGPLELGWGHTFASAGQLAWHPTSPRVYE
jgi:hypothetical protein